MCALQAYALQLRQSRRFGLYRPQLDVDARQCLLDGARKLFGVTRWCRHVGKGLLRAGKGHQSAGSECTTTDTSMSVHRRPLHAGRPPPLWSASFTLTILYLTTIAPMCLPMVSAEYSVVATKCTSFHLNWAWQQPQQSPGAILHVMADSNVTL